MAVGKTLTQFIKEEEGYIFSSGTHNMNDLLSKAYDLMVRYDLKEDLRKEILTYFVFRNGEGLQDGESLAFEHFYSNAHLNAKTEEINEIWCEDVYNLFNEVAPDGYHFGTSEGDGSLFGWFKTETDEDNLCPVCNENELHEDEAMNALSRKDNDTYICSDCARNEAMEEMNKHFGQ